MIDINPRISIPDEEVRFTFSRSGGPGGQNVNKLNTKVMLLFDVQASQTLSDEQKKMILHRLGNRISNEGVLQVVAMQHRTQRANREEALRRFAALLSAALHKQAPRKKTRVPRRAKEARLRSKKRRGALKASRTRKIPDE